MQAPTGLSTYFENEFKKEAKYLNSLGIPVTDEFVRSRLDIPADKTVLQRVVAWLGSLR